MEFVAMHYTLSHRQDTPYWKANFNKEWSTAMLNLVPYSYGGFTQAVYERGVYNKFDLRGGLHCIAAGMHWGPIDIPTLMKVDAQADISIWKKRWKPPADHLDQRKNAWKRSVKSAPNMHDFLKKKYYV